MLRKHLFFYLSLVLAFSLGFTVQAEAISEISVLLDGQLLSIESGAPEIVDGRTFVPLRALSEAMSLSVDFDSETSMVSVGGIFTHVIGDTFVTMDDDETVDIGVASYIKEGRTMVSMRLFGEALGANVAWNGDLRQVTLESPHADPLLPEMKRVENPRFGFSLEIPVSWEATDVSENGDGFMVFSDNLDIDIRAWGSNDVAVFGIEEILARYEENETMQTINEDTMYIVPQENGVEYVVLTDDISVHISVDHIGISEWLEENSAIVENMAFSLVVYETEIIDDPDMPIPGPISFMTIHYFDEELLESYPMLTEDPVELEEEGEGVELVMLCFDLSVTDFQINEVEFVDATEDEILYNDVAVVYGPEEIEDGVSLVLQMSIPELYSHYSVSFTDFLGNQFTYLIAWSGNTGDLLLVHYYPDAE